MSCTRAAGPLESPHHRPSGFSQSYAVLQHYANKPLLPSHSGALCSSPSVLFQRSQARLAAASLTTRAQPISPTRWLNRKNKKEKGKKKNWLSGVTVGSQRACRWEVGSSRSGCTKHFHNYHMEQAGGAKQPPQLPLALGKQRKSRVEQTTFEYLRPAHSKIGLHFLFSKTLIRLAPSTYSSIAPKLELLNSGS